MIIEIATVAFLVSSYVYHRWIENHPKPIPDILTSPRVDEGATIPLLYGRCRVHAPILAWAGSQRQIPRPNGRFAYFLDMFYVVGVPFYGGGTVALDLVFAGDVALFLNPASTGVSSHIVFEDPPGHGIRSIPYWGTSTSDKLNYFVDNKPARVFHDDLTNMVNFGLVEFFIGSSTQQISGGNDLADPISDTEGVLRADPMNNMYVYLTDDGFDTINYNPRLNPNIPASLIPSYRNVATCCLYHWCNGDGINLRSYGFEVTALQTGSAADFGHDFGQEADPASVIYDLLTSPFGKLALLADKIDLPSFQAASSTLLAEGHGYSRVIEQADDALNIINDVLKQIDAVLYPEPTTGKLALKLIRNDYDVTQLDDINPDNNAEAPRSGWYSVPAFSETLNQVRVTFTDRASFYADGLVIGQNMANAVGQGTKLRSVDLRFVGCCTRALAQKIASRELAVVSQPLAKATLVVNRSFYLKRPGDVVTLTWPDLGINKMVMRIARVNLGQLHAGKITIDMMRDIFDVSLGAFP